MPGMRSLSLERAVVLIDTLPTKYAAIAAIGVTTGCRISEILALRRFDLINADGSFKDVISFIKLKNKKRNTARDKFYAKTRKIEIPADYRNIVIRHLQQEEMRGYERPDDFVFRGKMNRHLSRLTVYAVFRKILGPGYGTHWMRKTFAQLIFAYFVKRNIADPMRALELTRKALGHVRIDTTVKYLGIDENAITTAQNDIFNRKKYEEKKKKTSKNTTAAG